MQVAVSIVKNNAIGKAIPSEMRLTPTDQSFYWYIVIYATNVWPAEPQKGNSMNTSRMKSVE
jgi:hypothetical protein